MKRIFSDILFFLLFPFIILGLSIESHLKLPPTEHKIAQMLLFLFVCFLVNLWVRFDIWMKERETDKKELNITRYYH